MLCFWNKQTSDVWLLLKIAFGTNRQVMFGCFWKLLFEQTDKWCLVAFEVQVLSAFEYQKSATVRRCMDNGHSSLLDTIWTTCNSFPHLFFVYPKRLILLNTVVTTSDVEAIQYWNFSRNIIKRLPFKRTRSKCLI